MSIIPLISLPNHPTEFILIEGHKFIRRSLDDKKNPIKEALVVIDFFMILDVLRKHLKLTNKNCFLSSEPEKWRNEICHRAKNWDLPTTLAFSESVDLFRSTLSGVDTMANRN